MSRRVLLVLVLIASLPVACYVGGGGVLNAADAGADASEPVDAGGDTNDGGL